MGLLQEAMVLEDRISAEELELFKKGRAMEEIMKERRRTKASESTVSDAAKGGVTWKSASGVQESRARVGSFSESGVDVNLKGLVGGGGGHCSGSWAGVSKKNKAVSGTDSKCKVVNDKSLEEMGFVPSAVSESAGNMTANRTRLTLAGTVVVAN